jgi:hypothetical protein
VRALVLSFVHAHCPIVSCGEALFDVCVLPWSHTFYCEAMTSVGGHKSSVSSQCTHWIMLAWTFDFYFLTPPIIHVSLPCLAVQVLCSLDHSLDELYTGMPRTLVNGQLSPCSSLCCKQEAVNCECALEG